MDICLDIENIFIRYILVIYLFEIDLFPNPFEIKRTWFYAVIS